MTAYWRPYIIIRVYMLIVLKIESETVKKKANDVTKCLKDDERNLTVSVLDGLSIIVI